MLTGQINLSPGGAIGFTKNIFSQPPLVFFTIIRQRDFNNKPVIAYITNINKDGFGFYVKHCDGSNYISRFGDKLNWLAIGF